MLQADGLQSLEEVCENTNFFYESANDLLIPLGSGIGRMLARGCAANGAHTILIDVNEAGLKETKSEIEKINQASTDSEPVEVVP